MATATEAASLNKTECDQLPTWKYKSSPILSVFQHFSLQHVLCYKAGLGTLPVSPSSYTHHISLAKSPSTLCFQHRTLKWGRGAFRTFKNTRKVNRNSSDSSSPVRVPLLRAQKISVSNVFLCWNQVKAYLCSEARQIS